MAARAGDPFVSRLVNELGAPESGVSSGDLRALKDRVAHLESMLSQRQEEIVQTWRELDERRLSLEELQMAFTETVMQREELERKLAEADSWVFKLGGERIKLEHALLSLQKKSEMIEARYRSVQSTLHESKGDLEKSVAELTQVRIDREQVERQLIECFQEIDRFRTEKEETEQRLISRTEEAERQRIAIEQKIRADQMEAEQRFFARIGEVEAEKAQLEQRLLNNDRQASGFTKLAQEKDAALATARSRIAELEGEKSALEQRLIERFREIAGLTRLIQERDVALGRFEARIEWLRQILIVLTKSFATSFKAKLLLMVPSYWRVKQQREDLKTAGLFDPDAYIAIYPDVTDSGTDPFRHYLNHGMKEGRSTGREA